MIKTNITKYTRPLSSEKSYPIENITIKKITNAITKVIETLTKVPCECEVKYLNHSKLKSTIKIEIKSYPEPRTELVVVRPVDFTG